MLEFFNNTFKWIYEHIAETVDGRYLVKMDSINADTLKYLAIVLFIIAVFNSIFIFEWKFLREIPEEEDN